MERLSMYLAGALAAAMIPVGAQAELIERGGGLVSDNFKWLWCTKGE